jgi:glycosyltransferase involved in cell wall biosynthesis
MSSPARAVTLVAHDIGPVGGMERQMSQLAKSLLDDGWSVTVVARRCELDSHPNLSFVRVRGPRRPFVVAYPWFLVAGSVAVRRHRRGVVHAMGAIVLNDVDVATVHFCHRAAHGTPAGRRVGRPGRARAVSAVVAERIKLSGERLLLRADHLVASSEGVAAELGAHWHADADVIPNGVDVSSIAPDSTRRDETRARWGVARDALIALFLAGDWDRKGLGPCIDAIGTAPEWQLVVVGPGDAEAYGRRAERVGAGGRVRFVGPTKDLPGAYAAGDAFVLPSAYESAPLALYEAAAAGLPLLATPFNGAREIIDDGETGWIVERSGASIAARLSELADAEVRERLSVNARKASLNFDWGRITESYVKLYEEVGEAA